MKSIANSVVTLDMRRLEQIAAALDTNCERVGVKFAHDVEVIAKQNAPFDTGALSASIAVVSREGGSESGADAALDRNPAATIVKLPAPTGDIYANVGPCVDYGEYQEFGTSRMGAQPFLLPAAEAVRERYNSGAEWRSIVESR